MNVLGTITATSDIARTVDNVARELHIDQADAIERVAKMTRAGVPVVDVFDVIADGWTAKQYHAEYGTRPLPWFLAIFTADFWISEDPNAGYSHLDRLDGLGRA